MCSQHLNAETVSKQCCFGFCPHSFIVSVSIQEEYCGHMGKLGWGDQKLPSSVVMALCGGVCMNLNMLCVSMRERV